MRYNEKILYEVPKTVRELLAKKEAQYRIVDYSLEMEMDNNQSMQFFLDLIGAEGDHINKDLGTHVIIQHEDFNYKLQIEVIELGDLFSHGFEVSLFEDE